MSVVESVDLENGHETPILKRVHWLPVKKVYQRFIILSHSPPNPGQLAGRQMAGGQLDSRQLAGGHLSGDFFEG